MKITNLSLISVVAAILITPATALAGNFDAAVADAEAEINKAKSMNYEWRDSRKMLKEAKKMNKEGKTDKAMKLVAKAKKQGQLAVAQAEQEAAASGPR